MALAVQAEQIPPSDMGRYRRAGGAQLNRRAVIARERIPRPQEQRVGLHPEH
jgi:hypothetical protein